MPVTLRLALRNIIEHKSKSLIVGMLLAMGSLMLVLGNSFIDASKSGIRSTFTDSYTGDVFVSGLSDEGDVSLFGVMSVGGLASTPDIPEYEKVSELVRSTRGVSRMTGMATTFGVTVKDESSSLDAGSTGSGDDEDGDIGSRVLFLFGIDPSNYWDVFNSVDITAGSRIEPGQQGLVLFDEHMANMSKALKRDLKIGDNVLVQSFSGGGMRLRELKILGTYHQKGEGATPSQMAFADIDSIRVMAGMTVGSDEAISLSGDQTAMLSAENTDSLFGDDLFADSPSTGKAFDEKAIAASLADSGAREKANTADLGAWQYIVVRTNAPSDARQVIRSLNDSFKAQGIQAVAGDWQKAAGPYGQSVDVVRIVFTVAIAILSVVAVIIIMNTFVISVIERTGEIGTMRAIGAERKFVRKLFAMETAVLSAVFSLLGAALGTGIVALLRSLRIKAGNTFFEVLFGGRYLSPFVSPVNFLAAVLAMLAVGYVAHLYPVSVALKIQPVRAMQNE